MRLENSLGTHLVRVLLSSTTKTTNKKGPQTRPLFCVPDCTSVLLVNTVLVLKAFRRFFVVMRRVQMVAVRDMRVVGCFFVLTFLMVFRCDLMMLRSMFMMFSGLIVMVAYVVMLCLCHDLSPLK